MRVLTDKRYWTKNNELHYKIFHKALARPDTPQEYSLELSGKALSKTKDIEKEAKDFCKRDFAGHIFQTVENLRSEGIEALKVLGCRSDVMYTPLEGNPAHSDLVFFGPDDPEKWEQRIVDWLQEFIQYASPTNCHMLEALRGKIK
ncbi:MAG: hypothetical protein K2Z80_37725 [Xanthobacteraceae bacterium]|nr:hypothetical protein [Xanthobacteraceae bacterium]